ncbi:hypothetical protein D3C84_890990 [compost metagenome]
MERLGHRCGCECHHAGDAIHRALHKLSRLQAPHQLIERLEIRHELQQQFQRAAARQAEAMRLVCSDAVAHKPGRRLRHVRLAVCTRVVINQVILDTATRDRTHAAAVFTQHHHRANRSRRRAPGLDHRHQHQLVTTGMPVACSAQHPHINTFHTVSPVAQDRPRSMPDPVPDCQQSRCP